MKRYLPLITLAISPFLGIVIATVIAWQVYPSRSIPDDATRAEANHAIDQSFEDVSARGRYMLWGGIAGGIVGVLGAGLLSLNRGKPAAKALTKTRLKCNLCGALQPAGTAPDECSWCKAAWSGTEVSV